jgi:hypothetical protein
MQPRIGVVRDLLFSDDTCLVIPPYQRPYEWNRDRWQGLIRDVVESLDSQRESHFIGVAITTESKPLCTKAKRELLHRHIDIIDGQQRLLTLRIWLQAILDHATDQGHEMGIGFTNVFCQETDLDDWNSVIEGKWVSEYRKYKPEESGLLHAYTYFRWVLWLGKESMREQEPEELPKPSRSQTEFANFAELEAFWIDSLEKRSHASESAQESLQIERGVALDSELLLRSTVDQLSLLVLEVNAQDEDPADIFNALNGQRTEMFQFDHLRNYIFANINDADERADLYDNTWRHVERQVIKQKIPVKGSSALDTFLYDLLISLGERKYQSISKDKTSRQFARYFKSGRNSIDGAKQISEQLLLPNLISWTSVKLNGSRFEIDGKPYELPIKVQSSLKMMECMSSGPVIPLLMNIVNRYYERSITAEELQEGISAVENYLGRFIISGDALSPLRAQIMNICATLGNSYTLDQLKAELKRLKHKDDDLKRRLLPTPGRVTEPYGDFGRIYESRTSKQLLAIFQAIERQLAGEFCSDLLRTGQDDQLTIDHIYPQSADTWKTDLRDWSVSAPNMLNRLHTLGNLGVIPKSINSGMSNKKFDEKKVILEENVFVELEVNKLWQPEAVSSWTPSNIDARAKKLLEIFLQYYPN